MNWVKRVHRKQSLNLNKFLENGQQMERSNNKKGAVIKPTQRDRFEVNEST